MTQAGIAYAALWSVVFGGRLAFAWAATNLWPHQVMQFSDIFRGKVVDVSRRSVTIEITGGDDKIEAFEGMVRPFGLIEMVRTGEIAVSRGRGTT